MNKKITKAEARRLKKNAKQRARRAAKKGLDDMGHVVVGLLKDAGPVDVKAPAADQCGQTQAPQPQPQPPHINDMEMFAYRVGNGRVNTGREIEREEIAQNLRRSHTSSSALDRYVRGLADRIESNGLNA